MARRLLPNSDRDATQRPKSLSAPPSYDTSNPQDSGGRWSGPAMKPAMIPFILDGDTDVDRERTTPGTQEEHSDLAGQV